MNDAMNEMINQVEWYLGQLRYMNGLQIDANNRNAELLQQVSRLKAENQRLRAEINSRDDGILPHMAQRVWLKA